MYSLFCLHILLLRPPCCRITLHDILLQVPSRLLHPPPLACPGRNRILSHSTTLFLPIRGWNPLLFHLLKLLSHYLRTDWPLSVGVTTPFILSNAALDISPPAARCTIRAFIAKTSFVEECRFAGPHKTSGLCLVGAWPGRCGFADYEWPGFTIRQ